MCTRCPNAKPSGRDLLVRRGLDRRPQGRVPVYGHRARRARLCRGAPRLPQVPARADFPPSWKTARARWSGSASTRTNWGGDPSRIVVMGHSVGAHLGAMLAYQPEYVRAAGGSAGGSGDSWDSQGYTPRSPTPTSSGGSFRRPIGAMTGSRSGTSTARRRRACCSMGWKIASSIRIETVRLRNALVRHGVPVEMELYSGRSHADTVAAFSPLARRRLPALNSAARFIDRLRPRRAAHRKGAADHAQLNCSG